jgi:hypothetical protein
MLGLMFAPTLQNPVEAFAPSDNTGSNRNSEDIPVSPSRQKVFLEHMQDQIHFGNS